MNKNWITWTRRLTKPLFRLGAASLVAAATAATGAESIALVGVPATSQRINVSPDPELRGLATYDTSIHKALETVARYPNRPEARNARLQGKVTVAFRIDRSGMLQEAEIVETSHSRILDAAALASVHWAKYQALPADLLPGETGRRYQMAFDYRFAPQD